MHIRPWLIALGLAGVVVTGVGIYAANRIEPADVVRLVAQQIKSQTGRDLEVGGKIDFSISMQPTISLEAVRFRNASWGTRADMLVVRRVDVGIALLPLLRGRVDIRGLRLIEPDLLLETDAKGRANWTFESSTATPATQDPAGQPLPVHIHHAQIERGTVTYRSAEDSQATTLQLTALEARTSGTRTTLAANGRLNAETIEVEARLDHERSPANLDMTLKARGVTLTAKGSAPAEHTQRGDIAATFALTVTDWTTIGRLAGTEAVALPALNAEGEIKAASDMVTIDGIKATLGRSSFAGRLHIDRSQARPQFDIRVDSPFVDLAELRGPAKKDAASADGRLFSAQPLPVAPLLVLNGNLQARIERLALRDAKTVDGVEIRATAAQGRISADPVRLRVEGKDIRIRANLDASSGKSLGVNLNIDGSGISLGALGALLNLTGTPEGSPTDLNIRFAGRGASIRALMAGADADVRIVIGPGRLRNRAIDWGADVTELLNAINPVRKSESYTELKCAVVRLPVRQGVARIENSIAAQTDKVSVIAAGVIDLRNESLDLGFRPKANTGLRIGLGGLASMGRLRGSLSAPKVELDMGGTAQAAAQLGLAAATGGLSLLAGGLLSDNVPDDACQAALSGAAARAPARRAPEAPAVVDSVVDGIKKLFGR